jgi:hypothetical protein
MGLGRTVIRRSADGDGSVETHPLGPMLATHGGTGMPEGAWGVR